MVLEIRRSPEDSPARESHPMRCGRKARSRGWPPTEPTVRAVDAYPSYFTIDLQRNGAVSGVCVRSIGQYFRGKGGSKMEA
jgi:hypothetical protein